MRCVSFCCRNIPQGGLGLAARLRSGTRGGARSARRGRRELALLSLDRLAHGGLLGLCGGSAGFFRVLLTLERVAKVLEAHSESDVDERCSDVEGIKDAEF